jgi:hypothetical protein
LTFRKTFSGSTFDLELCRPQRFSAMSLLCYPIFKAPQKIFYLLCCLLFTSGISSIIVQFSRCNFSGLF